MKNNFYVLILSSVKHFVNSYSLSWVSIFWKEVTQLWCEVEDGAHLNKERWTRNEYLISTLSSVPHTYKMKSWHWNSPSKGIFGQIPMHRTEVRAECLLEERPSGPTRMGLGYALPTGINSSGGPLSKPRAWIHALWIHSYCCLNTYVLSPKFLEN